MAETLGNETIRNHAAFIWSVADLLRGDYKQSEYGKVILPLTVIRRLDCVLEPTNLNTCRPPLGSLHASTSRKTPLNVQIFGLIFS